MDSFRESHYIAEFSADGFEVDQTFGRLMLESLLPGTLRRIRYETKM